jgi:hypothetical protein
MTAVGGPLSPPAGAQTGPVVTLYGQAGTFGGLASRTSLSSGHSLRARAVPGWGMPPGQAVFYGEAEAGDLLLGGFPLSSNTLDPTADHMAVSVFTPSLARYTNLVIPTSNGSLSAVSPYNGLVGGADAADLQVVTINGVRKVAFISGGPYHRWDVNRYGLYPSLGFLQKQGGQWVYDAAGSKTAQQLQERNGAAGRLAFPPSDDPYALSGTASNRLFAEIAHFPRSDNLAVNQYFGDVNGGFVALGLDGRLKGRYEVPPVPDSAGGRWLVSPKWIETDPTSRLGDERFFVQYDAYYYPPGGGPQRWYYPVQELSFNADEPDPAKAIRPISSAMTSPGYPDGSTYGYGRYDSKGNLWVGTSVPGGYGFNGGNVAVFVRDPATGRRAGLEGACRVPGDWPARGWRTTCAPDLTVDMGPDRAANGWVNGILEDTAPGTGRTGTLYLTTILNRVVPLVPSPGRSLREASRKPAINLDVEVLQAGQPANRYVSSRKGIIDVANRWLWVPTSSHYDTYQLRAPEALPHWAYRVDLDTAY